MKKFDIRKTFETFLAEPLSILTEGLFQIVNIQSPNVFEKSFNSKKSIVQYENNWHYTTLQSVLSNVIKKFEKNNQTLKGNKVKSLAEAKIANFLFLNDKDVYEITSKLYSFNLKLLDKSHYNLELKKGKLIL